jgi:parallel beta-helix repeat protein
VTAALRSRRIHRPVLVLAVLVLIAGCSFDSTDRYPRTTVSLPPSTTTPPSTTVALDANGAIIVETDDDLADMVESADAGSSFLLEPGVHRTGPIVPKDGMTFTGAHGAVVSGAEVLAGFAPDGDRWSLGGVTFSDDTGGECITGYDICGLPNDLFMDGVMLWRVASRGDVEPGSWWGGDGRIVIADDPTNRIVEMSVEPFAFVGSASDVTITNLTVEKFATPSQEGAIQAQEAADGLPGRGWVIEDVEVANNHAVGIKAGEATRITRVHAHHNGQLGIAVSGGTDVVISDSELSFNNTRGYFWEWEGGGGKFTRTNGLVVQRTFAHDNLGPGLWTDIDTVDTLYEGNTVTDNLGPGIFHEISGSAVIRDNDVSGNGFGKPEWAWGAGILISASFDVEVTGNRVFDNADGIAGIQQERGDGPLGPRILAGLHVHDNEIGLPTGTMGVVSDVGDGFVIDDRDIRFESNHYVGVGNRRAYSWDGRNLTRQGWVDAGQDVDGTWD